MKPVESHKEKNNMKTLRDTREMSASFVAEDQCCGDLEAFAEHSDHQEEIECIKVQLYDEQLDENQEIEKIKKEFLSINDEHN